MSRRSPVPQPAGPEPPPAVGAARHRLSATLGSPDGTGAGTGLLEPARAPAGGAGASADGPGASAGGPGRTPRDGAGPGPVPPGVRRRTGQGAAVLLGVVALLLGGWFWWRAVAGEPAGVPLSEDPPAGVHQQPPAPATGIPPARDGVSPEPARITVHVAGAVARPGVLELAAGSRLHQALDAAGGLTAAADPDRLNLAAVLEDGQKILMPERGQPEAPSGAVNGSAGTDAAGPAAAGGATPGDAGGGSRINLNTAGVEELGTLPRVGPVLAQRIVDWRLQHGRFRTVEDLDAVDGVGPKLLETLLPLVRV